MEKGLSSLGFSSHTFTGFSFDSCGISTKEKEEEYISSLENLREKYRSEIEIFIGLEEESRKEGTLEPTINPRLDYSIGSVHWFWINGKPFSVDYTAEQFRCQKAVLEFAVCPLYSGPGLVPLLLCGVHLLLDSVPVGLEVYHGDGIHMVVGEVPYVPAGISSIHQNIQEPDLLPRVFDNKKMEKMIV